MSKSKTKVDWIWTTTQRENHAIQNAQGWLESILEMVSGLDLDDDSARENAQETIQESVLEVTVRSAWYTLHKDSDRAPAEYNLLLTTGGPALRMIGSLSEGGEPETARLEWQDWGTPWTEHRITRDEETACLRFASCFYFGG